jgi:hypothetical protein
MSVETSDPSAMYQRATLIARDGDIFAWRSLVIAARDEMSGQLAAWWKKYGTAHPAAGHQVPDDPSKLRCDVPPVFEDTGDEIKRGAYRTLVKTGGDLRDLVEELQLDKDRIWREWPTWINVQKHSLHQLYPFSRTELTQERLIPDVFGK